MKVALAFSTKDRVDYTKQTLPRILDEAEGNFDLFWLDGSVTSEGKQFPADFAYNWRKDHDGKYPLKELHQNVGGGAAAVIQAAWKYMYDKKENYDYIGLIENDVLLDKNWFSKTMSLFEKEKMFDLCEQRPNFRVGAVSARCFTDRILKKYDDWALMSNVGAGMYLTKRELIIPQLENWNQPNLWVLQILCKHFTGMDYPIPPKVLEDDPKLERTWMLSHDWNFEFVNWMKGYCTLACVPSLAINLDDPDGKRDRVER